MQDFDKRVFRARIEHEDNLLNQRTALFLTANGLGAVAVGIGSPGGGFVLFISIASIVNVLWILCGVQSVLVLKGLTAIYIEQTNDPVDQLVRRSITSFPIALNPSNLLGLYLPVVIFIGWLLGAIYV